MSRKVVWQLRNVAADTLRSSTVSDLAMSASARVSRP